MKKIEEKVGDAIPVAIGNGFEPLAQGVHCSLLIADAISAKMLGLLFAPTDLHGMPAGRTDESSQSRSIWVETQSIRL